MRGSLAFDMTSTLVLFFTLVALPVLAAMAARSRGWHRPWQLVMAAYLGSALGGETLGLWMAKVWGPANEAAVRSAEAEGAPVAVLYAEPGTVLTLPDRLIQYLLPALIIGFLVSMYHLWRVRRVPRREANSGEIP